MKIRFIPKNIEIEVRENETILEASIRAGVNIDGNCAGMGTCGKCKVRLIEGSSRGDSEDPHHKLSELEYEAGFRLACCTVPKTDCTVEVPDADTTASRKKKLVKLPEGFATDKGEKDAIGVALDIGTTTLVVMFWNLETGEMLGVDAVTNPQGAYGADVISRTKYTMDNEDGLKTLHTAITSAVKKIVLKFLAEEGYQLEAVKKYTAVGNTTMSHIFLNIDPRSLAVAPFKPAFTGEMIKTAAELGLPAAEGTEVIMVPNIAGHVGSDITAGIITTDLMDRDKGHLFIDIGTNGEIVLSGKGRILTCSTAAGPAFEGSSIKYGMRAAGGAIERIDLSEEGVKLGVIGNEKPVGICGSGIIDAVGELIRVGVVDKSGKLLGKTRLERKGVPQAIIDCIEEDGKANNFMLYRAEDPAESVYITQKDVREVQLAKAAISAGIYAMMNEIGLTKDDLEKISVAGAFGSYVRIESATNMGLLPDIDHEKIKAIGNSAGVGSSMVLLSKAAEDETIRVSLETEHIDLAERSDFQDLYMKGMSF